MIMRSPWIAAAALLLLTASVSAQPTSPAHRADVLTGEPAPPLPAAAALAAQSRLAIGLVGRIARGDSNADNVVVSPASIAAVLSLLDLGAEEPMRRAIHRALGFDRRNARNAATELDGLRGSVSKLAGTREGPLSLANAVVFDPASAPYRLAVMGLRATGAEVRVEDLAKPETLRRINEWVAAQTKGLIPTILDEPPRDAGLVALNALYFKDRWRNPFDRNATAPAPFTLVDGSTADVPMMRKAGRFSLRQDERFVAVDLDYASEGFALVVITSKDKPARAAELTAAAGWLGGSDFKPSGGELALPRFSLEGKRELLPALDALGLRRARRSSTALSGLSPTPQVLTRVVQKTVLRVDEAGTEAAAATAATTTRALQTDFVKMTVDKPFLFALRERSTGLILLAGYVAKPAAAATQ